MSHSPLECARYLLGIFPSFNLRAGECLRQNSFFRPFSQQGWRTDDYNVGLELCLQKGWISIGPNGGICVTQAGLDEIDA